MYNPYLESVKILAKTDNYFSEKSEIQAILENSDSPITRKLHEKMYKAVINKSHIDFGDIPRSKGVIRDYSGYPAMIETIKVVKELAKDAKAKNVINYVDIIETTIKNIENMSSTYQKGFATKTEYVAMEYDTYVYFCVEATTALIYAFVDYIKNPEKQLIELKITDTKLRADAFYFDTLKKFNIAQDNNGVEYRRVLDEMCNKGKSNFIGTSTAIGIGVVAAAALSIVPITREIIYQVYNFRGKLSDHLELQAKFLELNRATVEANSSFKDKKKEKIIEKQSKMVKDLRKMADGIRVKSSKSIMDSQKDIKNDNKNISIDNIRNEISDEPFELL